MPVICLDSKKSLAFYSKYSISYICPDPSSEEKFIQYLIDFGKDLPHKGVIFVSSDDWLVTISKNRNKLSEYYLFPMSEWEIIQNCWNKRKLYEIAQENGIACTKTYYIDRIYEIDAISKQITFPCIIKPELNINFQKNLGSRGSTLLIQDYKQLMYWKEKIIEKRMEDIPLIIQELIVGPITNLYTITSYSDSSAEIVAYSIGHKIRQFPPDAGTIISGRVKDNPEIYELGKKLIKIMGYYGIANVEFKKDERDQIFKLVEINPRPGMWNYSVLMSGLNLPHIAYLDLLGDPYELPANREEGKVWIMLIQDFLYSIFLFRFIGYKEYSIGIGEWFRSTKGKKIHAVESWKDPLPGLINFIRFLSQSFGRFKNMNVR